MKTMLKKLPGMSQFVESSLWRSYRHMVSLRKDPRVNRHFTGFMRLPAQFDALAGPVVEFLLSGDVTRPIRIFSIGSSIGAEAYTAASCLTAAHPSLDYKLLGFDIDGAVVEKANSGVFDAETEVLNDWITPEFVAQTFDIDGDTCAIKPEIHRRCEFHVADILDDGAVDTYGKADLILAQNFLFHLEPRDAEVAFDKIYRLLADRAVLFVDGTDIPIRNRQTKKHGLKPLEYRLEEIHNQARWVRGEGWPYHYWGLEPFMSSHRDWRRRYATIFLKED
jgi:chemotaxis protein methyltransferase CheR